MAGSSSRLPFVVPPSYCRHHRRFRGWHRFHLPLASIVRDVITGTHPLVTRKGNTNTTIIGTEPMKQTPYDRSDLSAAEELIRTALMVEFQRDEPVITPCTDGENLHLSVEIVVGIDDEDPEDIIEWSAMGLLFTLAALSFDDARPRGHSELDFMENDQLTMKDFLGDLHYVQGELRFSADYIRGRCLKTDLVARPNGRISISTLNRGVSASRWLDRLQGKNPIRLVHGSEN